ncbi:MAG: hypothetical protein NUV53_02495 [Patescibacteria group bacterium]|nr:hypothetical protein [Patescibacteria group bacterium]
MKESKGGDVKRKCIEGNKPPIAIRWCLDMSGIERYGFDLNGALRKIVDAFSREPHLLGVMFESVRASFMKGLSVIGFTAIGEVVCHARLIPLTGNWFELGSTYVFPEYRGKGANHAMYSVFLPRHTEKDILATTTNPISRRVGEDLNFMEVPRRRLPSEAWRASCTCSVKKMGAPNAEYCSLAFGEAKRDSGICYFRITPETAARHGL